MNVRVVTCLVGGGALAAAACFHSSSTSSTTSTTMAATVAASPPTAAPNTLSPAERAAGWKLLFDGQTTNGWRGYQMTTVPREWSVVDGTLTKSRTTEDIVTVDTYANFELTLEWKIDLGGNSGIFYRATEEYDHVYWSAPEYQLADDSLTPDSKNIMTSVAAVYGFYPSRRGVNKPAGQWNSARIVVNGAHVEHWLNGVRIASYELWSKEWMEKLHGVPGDSTRRPLKFAPYANFGLAKTGFVAIQGDHNGALALRNIKIRELK